MADYEALAEITLGTAASSVTFSSISQNYKDLVLVANAIGTANAFIGIRVNGLTGGSDYYYSQAITDGAAIISSGSETARGGNQSSLLMVKLGASKPAYSKIQILNYSVSGTTRNAKPVISEFADSSAATRKGAFGFGTITSQSSNITSLTVGVSATTMSAGSTLCLYGVKG
jgi:hypothetical protein